MGKQDVLIKIFDIVVAEKFEINAVLNKISFVIVLDHPRIQKFYGLYQQKFNNNVKLGLIYSYSNCVTLDDFLKSEYSLTPLHKIELITEIAETLE